MPKGSEDWICETFYQELPVAERLSFRPGQLYSGLVVYPSDRPEVLTVDRYDPKEQKVSFSLTAFSAKIEPHYPVASLGLASDEFLVVQQGKRRPVIILGAVAAEWIVGKTPQKLYLCAPIFSFKDLHSQDFVLRVQAFCYPNLFYLPAASPGLAYESVVRLELTQPILKGALQPVVSHSARMPLALSEDAHLYFLNHLSLFLLGSPYAQHLDDLVAQYRQELLGQAGLLPPS
jgi:hypothetical protein